MNKCLFALMLTVTSSLLADTLTVAVQRTSPTSLDVWVSQDLAKPVLHRYAMDRGLRGQIDNCEKYALTALSSSGILRVSVLRGDLKTVDLGEPLENSGAPKGSRLITLTPNSDCMLSRHDFPKE